MWKLPLERAVHGFKLGRCYWFQQWYQMIHLFIRHQSSTCGNRVSQCKECCLKDAMDALHMNYQNGMHQDSNSYASLLQLCVNIKALEEGTQVHAMMIKSELKPDAYTETKLLIMYAKCGAINNARQVFDKMSERNVVSWNAMITGYVQAGRIKDAHMFFGKIPERNVVSWNAMITAYSQNGCTEDARQLFDIMPQRDAVSWNAMIAGYFQNGKCGEALKLFSQMQTAGLEPNRSTFTSLLSACASLATLSQGQQIHAHIIQKRFESDVFLGSALVNFYAKCGNIEDLRRVFESIPQRNVVSWNSTILGYIQNGRIDYARHVFDKVPERNVVSWSTMIAGYAQNGMVAEARELFDEMSGHNVVSWTAIIAGYVQNGCSRAALELFLQMQRSGIRPNQSTLSSIVSACGREVDLEQGLQIHAHAVKLGLVSDAFIESSLVDMYVRCMSIENAQHSFDKLDERHVVSCNVMITGYAQIGRIDDALRLFDNIPEPDVTSWNAMIAAYGQNGRIEDACQLFNKMPERNVVSWTTMIAAFAQNGQIGYARQLFDRMPERDVVSWTAMITGYVENCRLEHARQLFDNMPERNMVSWNAMIAGLAQHGRTEEARQLFDNMPNRNVIAWTAMTSGYAENGLGEEAFKLYSLMCGEGMKPNESIFTGVLNACSSLAAMELGKQIHVYIIKTGLESDVVVANALITMYAKCGNLNYGHRVFREMPERDAVSWNAMISGYALHGCGKEGLQLFEEMQQAGMMPDSVTFLGVLSACSHAGLVDEGEHYFDIMSQLHGITPRADHYACMVDLLGRAGCLDEAEKLINSMAVEPDVVVWRTLLGACRIHGNVKLGEHAAEQLLVLEPQNAATYVTLSNIYGAAGRWDDAAKVRAMMKDKGVEKKPGCSWIEVKNQVHTFLVGDRSHPQTHKIYATLENLIAQMQEAGYVPNTDLVLHDVEQKQKECILYYHSEKLAIAFGIISTPFQAPLWIMKNLRVCHDCHTAIRFISKITQREIVVRDAIRFHHFKEGSCSCGNYW